MKVVTRATSCLLEPAEARTRSIFCMTARNCDSISSPTISPVAGSYGTRLGRMTTLPIRAPTGSDDFVASRYNSWKTSPSLIGSILLQDRHSFDGDRHTGRDEVYGLVEARTRI